MNIFELHKYQKRLKCFSLALGFVILANGGIKRNLNNVVSDDSVAYEMQEETVENNSALEYEIETKEDDNTVTNYNKTTTLDSDKKLETEIETIVDVYETQPVEEAIEEIPKSEKIPEQLDEQQNDKVVDNVVEELSYEEKMQIICEREALTYEELDTVLAGCVAESCDNGNNYDEAYNTASTVYNRAHDIAYVYDVSNICGKNTGYSIYYQFICRGQFSVYKNGTYRNYLGRIDLPGYQAAIDMFYSRKPSHDYLVFNNVPLVNEYERLVSNGNFYWSHQKLENIIIDEDVNERVLSK